MTPTLAGAGIVLRPLALSDAEALFVALSDPAVQLYRNDAPHADVAETRAYITTSLASGLAWAITENGGEALGRIALRVNGDVGEFGIVVRRAAQRRKLATEALALAEAHAFHELHLSHLRAEIDAENAASLALFARAGFVRETRGPGERITHLGPRDNVLMVKWRA